MHRVVITDRLWNRILALRKGVPVSPAENEEAAFRLYRPVAAAEGPFVLAQVGQSLDGRVATPKGDARDISGPDGICHLHRCRALVDAVLVGIGTVKADDPRLSVRAVSGPSPARVIVDPRAELSGEERIFRESATPLIVFRTAEARRTRLDGSEVVHLPRRANGIDPRDMRDALAARGLERLLVEGGGRTIARFIDAGLVDRLHVAVAPLIIGSGPTGISLPPIDRLDAARRPLTEVYALGSDIVFDCDLRACRVSGRKGQEITVADEAPGAGTADVGLAKP
ncbi:RibD family protein [Ensifer soli]|uniref:RibD family protein n=1 Tax=Ciceribacter sp. sgz301302 TaxID=3342379 RepID=UPI0035BAA136